MIILLIYKSFSFNNKELFELVALIEKNRFSLAKEVYNGDIDVIKISNKTFIDIVYYI